MITDKNWSWGLTKSAERINGRFAMIGIILLILIEVFLNKSLLSLINII